MESVLPSTGADLDMYRAVPREVHLPYFTNGNAMEPVPTPSAHPNPNPQPNPNPDPHPHPHPHPSPSPKPDQVPPASARRRDVGFAGSLRHREWIEEELRPEDVLYRDEGSTDPASLRAFLRDSKFALQPTGDTQVLIEGDMRVGVQPSGQQVDTATHSP